MANNGHNDTMPGSNGPEHGAAPVRAYGMGRAAAQRQPSQPGPAPYQPQGYAGQQVPAGRPYAGQPGYGPRYGVAYPQGQVPPGAAAYVPPATSVAYQVPKKRRGARFWVGIAVAILCVVLLCALVLFQCSGQSKRSGEAGQLEGKTPAEIQAELDRQVQEGMFNISIASTAQFETGTSEGDLRIENVPGNPYLMQVSISRDDTGEEVYRTDMIEPNHHIQRDALDVDLDPGNYECTATFYACDKETEEVVGQAAAKMLIVVTG